MLLSMYYGKMYHTSNDIIISQQEKKSSSRPLVDGTFFAELRNQTHVLWLVSGDTLYLKILHLGLVICLKCCSCREMLNYNLLQ